MLERPAWHDCMTGWTMVHNCSLGQRQRMAADWHGPLVEAMLR